MEKQATDLLPTPAPSAPRTRSSSSTTKKLLVGLLAVVLVLAHVGPLRHYCTEAFTPASASTFKPKPSGCEQVAPLLPSKDVHDISKVWNAKDRIIAWHQDCVRIPTEVWDEMGAPGEDTRWDVFERLHEHFERSYPLVHQQLRRTKVDTWGLIYEWEGKDKSLKPLFITGHQGGWLRGVDYARYRGEC